MNCPYCGNHDCQVLESRSIDSGQSLRRRRECNKCKRRFTTYEKVANTLLWVIKKDGRREPFDKDKIKSGILRAIRKRPVSLELVDDITDRVERQMLRKQRPEVSSKLIGQAVLRSLKKVDRVAWLRFASVYLEFDDLRDFEKAIDKK